MTVLLTGFEPFEGQPVNASWLAVQAVAAAWTGPALRVVRLPVSFARAPSTLLAALAAERPDVVVCVGEAGERSVLEVERVAVNVADARIPDNDGAQPVDAPVAVDGPVAGDPRGCADGRVELPGDVCVQRGVLRARAGVRGHGDASRVRARAAYPEQGPTGAGMPTPVAARGLTALLEACRRA